MKILLSVVALGAAAHAQNNPILSEDRVKVSEHVWAIMGFPNVGIVVGASGTLVVDTGLGPRNGATVARLGALHVLPDHSAVGDGSLVAQEKGFIVDLRTRALELKRQGVSADDAGKQLTAEFKAKYAGWPINGVAGFVRSVYAE